MTILYERLLQFAAENLPGNRSVFSQKRSAPGQYKPCSTVTEMVTKFAALNWPNDRKIVLLIDEAERLFQLDSNSFSVLLLLPEMLDYKIVLVMASREQFDDFGPSVTRGLVPIKIPLKGFSYFETRDIIIEQLKNEKFPLKDIESSIRIVQQVANSTVKELSVLRNLTTSILSVDKTVPTSKLPKLVQERMDESNRLESFFKQTSSSLNLIEKHLLISAFIASFQTTREDSKTFGSILKKSSKKFNPAKDQTNSKNSDKLTIQLPKLFDQTRLIAIFYFIIEGLTILPSPQQLQLTIKSLCDRGLLKFSGNSAVKIDSLKYRINISRDFATIIANDLQIELDKYISA